MSVLLSLVSNSLLIEVIGWVAAAEIVLAYALVSSKKIDSGSVFYQLLNFTGGILFVIYTVINKAYASAFVNVVWVIIAIISLISIFLKYKK